MCFLSWYRAWKAHRELVQLQREELRKRSEECDRYSRRQRIQNMHNMPNKG
jgi:hypothetical protein